MDINRRSITNLLKNHLDLLLFAVSIVFFLSFPDLDLLIASQFYDERFHWDSNPLVRLVYHIFAKIHLVFLLILIGLIVRYSKKSELVKKFTSIYILTCLLLGPGVLVNILMKDNSIGRPRPVHVTEFGGDMNYTAPFHYSGECRKNCSFVSGHASIGFFAMVFYWVSRRRSWLISGVVLGLAVGFTRIIQGGHFLSDVIFAGWAVYFTCYFLSKFFNRRLLNGPSFQTN